MTLFTAQEIWKWYAVLHGIHARSSNIKISVFGCQSADIHIPIDENQTLVHIMVLGVVTSYGDVMLAFNFSHGLTLNTETCIKYLDKALLSWSEWVAAGRP